MEKKFTEEDFQEIEKQLSHPNGANGIEIAKEMHKSNIGMTQSSVQSLDLKDSMTVLELGHGSCAHLDLVLGAAEQIKYFGLEVSETMWEEAQKLNSGKQADFKLYDGEKIPFEDNFFDRIFTVNTVYFWPKPEELINEIERVLKPGGIFVLTYADKSYMQNLPFVGERFSLFDKNAIQGLTAKSNLSILDFKDETDEVMIGVKVQRNYTVVKLVN